MKQISWFSPPGIGEAVGYGYAAVQSIRALNSRGVNVIYDSHKPMIHVSFIQPEYYHGEYDQYRIGYTPWESTVIPKNWPREMQEMDEIWTTSQFCVDIFEDYKVNDTIRLMPHGIDPDMWKIESRFVFDKFVFFHVGGTTARKGGQRVVDAFLDLFDGRDDVVLLLKSNGDTETRCTINGQFGSAKRHPQIKVIDYMLSTEDLVKLYNAAHCLVYPTNGEGFGLIPFQGIATGLPTIVTDATACADFASLSVPLGSHPAPGVGVHLGDWVEPDLDDLRDKMLYVFNNYEEVKQHTMNSARLIHATQTWEAIADKMIDVFGEKIEQKA